MTTSNKQHLVVVGAGKHAGPSTDREGLPPELLLHTRRHRPDYGPHGPRDRKVRCHNCRARLSGRQEVGGLHFAVGWRYVEAGQIISCTLTVMLGAAHHVSNAGKDKRLLG